MSATLRDQLDGLRDLCSALHTGPGTPTGEPRDDCPGCVAQSIVDALAARVQELERTLDYIANGVDNPRAVAHAALVSQEPTT